MPKNSKTKLKSSELVTVNSRIHIIREQRVILDLDLAEIYGVTTKRLNEQIRRNLERFPEDFMFRLSNQEVINLKSQFATSSWGGRRKFSYAFTEHGAVMAATILNSPIAIEASISLVRVFIRMRELLHEHADLKRRLDYIEGRIAKGFAEHEQELQEIRLLIAQLEKPVSTTIVKKRRIGF